MGINREVVGRTFGPFNVPYTIRDTAIYALAVGADETEKIYFYEKYGPQVIPSFAAVPAFQAAVAILPELGLENTPIVHGTQGVRLSGLIPPEGTFETVITVRGIYDKGSGALLDFLCKTRAGGEDLFENEIGFFVPGAGGFGGERGPKAEKIGVPERHPDFRVSMNTSRSQSILYELSFLPDPELQKLAVPRQDNLHINPDAAKGAGFGGPLLQGLCTLGYLVRAAVGEALENDPTRVRGIRARFSAPVYPGQALVAEYWKDGGRLIARMKDDEGTVVISDAAITCQ